MVLKLSIKVHFLQFCADLSQKPTCVKAIYINGSEIFNCSLSENDTPYRGFCMVSNPICILGVYMVSAG